MRCAHVSGLSISSSFERNAWDSCAELFKGLRVWTRVIIPIMARC